MKKVEELKVLGCSVRGRFYDLTWSKPVLRAPAVHGVSINTPDLKLNPRVFPNKNTYNFGDFKNGICDMNNYVQILF